MADPDEQLEDDSPSTAAMPSPSLGTTPVDGRYDLSVMLGGPLYQLYRRTHVSGAALELLHRRVIALALLAWLPLLVLSLTDGLAWTGVKVPFLLDISTHVRFLVALPLLIFAELLVHERMPGVVRQFVTRGIVDEATRPKFQAAIDSATRLRNSIVAEILLLVFVYAIGVGVLWRSEIALPVTTWYRQVDAGAVELTRAGWWYLLVSTPIFQFLLFRWYFRVFIWARFLWRVSRIELKLMPLHPDRNGGLGFLSGMPRAFAPLLLAHGVLLAGVFADGIFFAGETLLDYKFEATAVLVFLLAIVVGPLLVFMLAIERAKRAGTREYGMLAQRYVQTFDRKWLHGAEPGEALLGTADIQSLADLGNSFEVVKEMKLIPVSRSTLLYLVVITALPVVPLLLTMIPLNELLKRLAKLVL
jgi:hypothetical protein